VHGDTNRLKWLFVYTSKRAKHKDALREQRERMLDEEKKKETDKQE